jgi:hypothetical protein
MHEVRKAKNRASAHESRKRKTEYVILNTKVSSLYAENDRLLKEICALPGCGYFVAGSSRTPNVVDEESRRLSHRSYDSQMMLVSDSKANANMPITHCVRDADGSVAQSSEESDEWTTWISYD